MKKLDFESSLIGTRYPSDFALPDYIRDERGNFLQKETLDLAVREEYGYVNDKNLSVAFSDVTDKAYDDAHMYDVCDKAVHKCINVTLEKNGENRSFPFDMFIPKVSDDPIFFIHLDFVKELPTKYCPLEELMDRKIGLCHIYYADVTKDNNDFNDGVSPLLSDRSKSDAAGKISIWAYSAYLVARYLIDNGIASPDRIYVIGHSRLGKTAQLACALYDVFAGCCVNDSGCCGAAISRDKREENLRIITDAFPFWFTPSFPEYADREYSLPFDQHYVMAACLPKYVFVTTASLDTWADTDAQYLCAEAASAVYREAGLSGLDKTVKSIKDGEFTDKGEITFKKRIGPHFLSREDWNFFIDCAEQKTKI